MLMCMWGVGIRFFRGGLKKFVNLSRNPRISPIQEGDCRTDNRMRSRREPVNKVFLIFSVSLKGNEEPVASEMHNTFREKALFFCLLRRTGS